MNLFSLHAPADLTRPEDRAAIKGAIDSGELKGLFPSVLLSGETAYVADGAAYFSADAYFGLLTAAMRIVAENN
jgi:hypothetical protein